MDSYDRSIYETTFASLLDQSLRKGSNDPERALKWLNRPMRYFFALLRTSNRLEVTDAFLDVREHLTKRIELMENVGEDESEE